MKSQFTTAALASGLLFTLLPGCSSNRAAKAPNQENAVVHQPRAADLEALASAEPLTTQHALLYVNGLSCPLCATNVDVQLMRVKGVQDATVDLGTGTVLITMPGETKPSPRRLANAVEDAGFSLVKIESN